MSKQRSKNEYYIFKDEATGLFLKTVRKGHGIARPIHLWTDDVFRADHFSAEPPDPRDLAAQIGFALGIDIDMVRVRETKKAVIGI